MHEKLYSPSAYSGIGDDNSYSSSRHGDMGKMGNRRQSRSRSRSRDRCVVVAQTQSSSSLVWRTSSREENISTCNKHSSGTQQNTRCTNDPIRERHQQATYLQTDRRRDLSPWQRRRTRADNVEDKNNDDGSNDGSGRGGGSARQSTGDEDARISSLPAPCAGTSSREAEMSMVERYFRRTGNATGEFSPRAFSHWLAFFTLRNNGRCYLQDGGSLLKVMDACVYDD